MADITEIKRAMVDRAQDVAAYLLPRGRLQGREWVCGDITGAAGDSLKVAVSGHKVGVWRDFAAGDDGGDLIDLWVQSRGLALGPALDEIRGWLGMERPAFERKDRVFRRPERPACQVPKSAVLEYLTQDRLLTADAIRAYRIGERGRDIVFPSPLPGGELAFVKYLSVDRTPDGKKKTRVEADCEPVLFGWQATNPNSRECTITEGELDAMTAWDYRLPCPMSVPFGGGKGDKQRWIEREFERMARFETIYLAVDMDAEGDAAAEEIANRLGRHRCRRVQLPRKDLNDCRKGGVTETEITACFAIAKTLDPVELVGAADFTDDVIRAFWPQASDELGSQMPFSEVSRKVWFKPGDVTLWTGSTGAGKSQVLSHVLVHAGGEGHRACVASLEMKPTATLKRMVKQSANMDRPQPAEVAQIMAWLGEWLWIYDQTGKIKVERILTVFEYARARYGCDVFVIDSLMRLGLRSDDYAGQDGAMFEVVSWALQKNVHVHMVAHARKEDRSGKSTKPHIPDAEDVKGASEVASNAANVIGIWRNREMEAEIAKAEKMAPNDIAMADKLRVLLADPAVILNVAKARNGEWEGVIGLWFNRTTYQYRGKGDPIHGHAYVDAGAVDERAVG